MVNIGPQWKGDLSAHFIADVSQPRHVSFRVPADPLIASVQSASLLRLAQELQPETLHIDPKWEKPDNRPRPRGRGRP